MEQRKMGTSDIRVSVLGMGCWQFGGGDYWGPQSQQDVDQVVHMALDQGMNYFDTAEVYNDGDSETSLGQALQGKRDQAVIGSKISTSNLYPSKLKLHCEQSLKRLQTDYIDIYMVHWAKENSFNPPEVPETFKILSELQKEGKIRHIGISNHGIEQMKEVSDTGISVISNELSYNLFSRAIEAEILPYCVEHQIGVIGYSPLLQGLLTDKYADIDAMGPMQSRTRHFHHSRGEGTRHGEEGAETEIKLALKQIQEIAGDLGVPLAVLSIAWCIANPGITSTIVGSRNKQQLAMNLQGANLRLPFDIVNKLNDITASVWEKLGNSPDYYENRQKSRVQ